MESLRDPPTAKSSGTVPEGGSRCVYDVLYIIFLLAIVSLSSLILIPRVFETMTYPKEAIDQVIKVDEIIPNDPGEVIGPHNEHKYRKTTRDPGEVIGPHNEHKYRKTTREPETEDYTEEPLPTVPPREMKPHPEESDEDDLPLLYHRLNPARTKRVIYRLAEWLRPISYDVALKVGVRGHNGEENSWVKGSATIKFMVVGDASNLLEIHGEFFKDLQMGILKYGTGQELKSIRQFYNWEKRTYSWLLEQPLIDGETYTLMLSWKASIGQGVLGLYETWYSDGNMNWYSLTTHGEPMSTRKWMPCFDEPALKATLKLTVTHPSSLQARSNGRIISTQFSDDGKTMTSSFAPTLSISPYLYALSVTDYVEMKDTVAGIPISVVVPPPYKSKLNSSLQLAKKSVNAYLSVLKADRIFDKMDFVFVPDHNTAMENVGHITFGISYLDSYPTYAHEMMHNYFGNLITLSWWDEVWINEGLTTVYEIDAVCGIGTEAAVKHYRKLRENVMIQLDSFRKAIPLKFDVRTEVEADVNFQKPYTKGAIVLLMIRNFVGEKAWKTGIENFVDKFKFQAVNGMDFLRTIIEATNENGNSGYNGQTPLLTMMMARSFFENRGFPLVRITRNGRTIELRQERFHRGFINGNMKDNKQKWAIPIHLMKLDGTSYKTFIMPDQSLSIDVDLDDELVLDPSKIVFYRAVYDKETYSKILTSSLSNAAKNEMVEDLLYAAYSGYVDPPLAYSVFSKRKSSNYLSSVVWDLHTQVTLLHPDRLFATVQIYNNKSKSEFVKWEKARYTVNKAEYCDGVETEADLMTKYAVNRTWKSFLCPKIIDSMELQNYKKIIKTGLDLSKPQQLHPMDFERLIFHYNNIIPNIVADVLLEMAPSIEDEFVLAKMISRTRRALDARSTPQLRQLVKIAPAAARQNAVMITKIFNERHAIETEDKLDKAFRKVFATKLKSRKYKMTVRKPVEIPEESFRRLKFY